MQLGDLLSHYGSVVRLDSGLRRNSMMLLNLTRDFSRHIYTTLKYVCRAPRPVDYAAEVQPMIQTPDHSSYPSGHATEAFALAAVLHRLQTGHSAKDALAGNDAPMVFRVAQRIAANRTVAGVHFPIDSWAGAWVGCQIAELMFACAQGDDTTPPPPFEAADYRPPAPPAAGEMTDDFLLSDFELDFSGHQASEKRDVSPDRISALAKLWEKAAEEWA